MAETPGTTSSLRTLAVHGGQPVRRQVLPYGRHTVEADDLESVAGALRSAWLTTGPSLERFEASLAGAVGAREAVAFSSGTAALHGAAFAAGLDRNAEPIVTPLSFCATANCVLYVGARPVFADVREDTLTLDVDRVAERLSESTKAVIVVDYAGHPGELDALLALCRSRGLMLIEDACHALGAEYRGRKIGSVSDMTVFSFHPVKHITTGEGGAVTTDDPALAAALRRFRNHGIDRDAHVRARSGDWYYEMTDLGYNYRLTDLGAALGLSQLSRLEANLARRRTIASRYDESFGQLPSLERPHVKSGTRPAWHLYPVRLKLERLRADRAAIFRALRAEGIGVNVHYIPIPWHPYYQRLGFRRGGWPVAESAYERLISLPLWHGMSDQDVEDVIAAVHKVCEAYAV